MLFWVTSYSHSHHSQSLWGHKTHPLALCRHIYTLLPHESFSSHFRDQIDCCGISVFVQVSFILPTNTSRPQKIATLAIFLQYIVINALSFTVFNNYKLNIMYKYAWICI